IASLDRQRFLPVLPIFVFQQDSDGRADGLAMTHTGEEVRAVALDLHTAAAAVALLPPPQFTVHKRLIHGNAGGQAADGTDQRLAMRFSGSKKTQHDRCRAMRASESKIVNEGPANARARRVRCS